METLGLLVRVLTEEQEHASAVRRVEASLGDIQAEQVRVDDPELEDVFVALLLRQGRVKETVAPLAPSPGLRRNDGLAIEARGLIREFGTFRAVDQVSFQVKQGEIFGLLGANGAGKTTVIKMLNGIMPPSRLVQGGWRGRI